MASTLALKKLVSSNLLPRSLRALRPAPASSRLFSSNAVRRFDEDDEGREVDVDPRAGRSLSRRRDDFLSDAFDPFSPPRTLSQVLNLMDQFMDNPVLSATRGMGATGLRRGWDAKETDDSLNLRIDMPGLSKEHVKVSVEQNTLVIKGEGPKEDEADDEDGGRRYTSRIDLPEKMYRTEQIKAEMKNGVLKVVIPKVKEEERTDVRNVQVN